MGNVLEVKDLHVHFPTSAGNAQILNGFNIELKEHAMLGLVGESGSGICLCGYGQCEKARCDQ